MKTMEIKSCLWVAAAISAALLSANAAAQNAKSIDVSKARIAAYWTSERKAQAIPRDLVIDPRGLGYLRRPDGTLVPYGHGIAAQAAQTSPTPSPFAKPGGGGTGDTTPPAISGQDPASGATIGASYAFKATVTDGSGSGVRSVTFKIQKIGSATVNSFGASSSGGGVWSVSLQGFSDGNWQWWVEAKDKAGNAATTSANPVAFKVSTTGGGGGGGSGGIVTNAQWTAGGNIQNAAGRLYFEMPGNARRTRWVGYVCSGTVATDGTTGRSVILTASHCVYDDANKAFARNVMFIPDQAHTTGTGTDLNCGNDPMGCWIPSFGVVDVNWTTRTFPDNVAWDYAFYVVNDTGAHQQGINSVSSTLDAAAGSLAPSFADPNHDVTGSNIDYTYALGYSYSEDPKFMYCAEDLATLDAANWWLGSCGLSGGSSGGPWVQNGSNAWIGGSADGKVISVNSWGYTNQPGMAGPKLYGTSASCVFSNAKSILFTDVQSTDGNEGKAVTCP